MSLDPSQNAVVGLTLRDRLDEGLARAREKLAQFGRTVHGISGRLPIAGEFAAVSGAVHEATMESRTFTRALSAAGAVRPLAAIDIGGFVGGFSKRLMLVATAGRALGKAGQTAFGLIARSAKAAAGVIASPFAAIEGFSKGTLGRMAGAISANFQGLGAKIAAPFSWAAGKFRGLTTAASELWKTGFKGWAASKLMGPLRMFGPGAAAAAAPALAGAASGGGVASAVRAGGVGTAAMGAAANAPAALSRGAAAAASAGHSIGALGKNLALGSAAIAVMAAPIALLTKRFAGLSAEMQAAAKTTGASVSDLSALRWAGEQIGLSFEQVADMVKQSGVDKAAAALGTSLSKAREEAARAGVLMTADQAKAGAEIAGAWKTVKREIVAAVDSIAIQFGTTFATSLQETAANVKAAVGAVRGATKGALDWAAANKETVQTLTTVLTTAGTLAGVGLALGAALTVGGTALGAFGTVAAFVLNPLTLVTAALIGGAYYWTQYTESGRAAFESLTAAFAPMAATAKSTIGGIRDALTAGDLSLAARIAGTGLQLGILQGVQGIGEVLPEQFRGAFEDVSNLIYDAMSGNWSAVIADMSGLWASFCGGVVSMFTTAAESVVALWSKTVSGISSALVKQAMQEGALGAVARTLIGSDPRKFDDRKRIADLTARIDSAERAFAAAGPGEGSVFSDRGQVSLQDLENMKSERARRQRGLDQGTSQPDAVMDQARASIAESVAQYKTAADEYLQALRDQQKAATDTAREDAQQRAQAARERMGQSSMPDRLKELQDRLDELNKEAADKAAAANKAAANAAAAAADVGIGEKAGAGRGANQGPVGAWASSNLAQVLGLSAKPEGDQVMQNLTREQIRAIKALPKQVAAGVAAALGGPGAALGLVYEN